MAQPVVALVLVSHSRALADGLVEVAAQMAPDVTLVAAGGTHDGGIGTGFDRVLDAVEAATADGRWAVVLTDLGSAVLTAESVLEAVDPDVAERVRLADAPFVEGAVEAAVAAQGGADVDGVLAAARRAGGAFGPVGGTGPATAADTAGGDPTGSDGAPGGPGAAGGEHPAPGAAGPGTAPRAGAADPTSRPADHRHVEGEPTAHGTVVLRNRLGLHARPAASVARTASAFRSSITVNGADARSVLALVALGAVGGTEVVVAASGPDARTAVNAVVAELEEGFGEA